MKHVVSIRDLGSGTAGWVRKARVDGHVVEVTHHGYTGAFLVPAAMAPQVDEFLRSSGEAAVTEPDKAKGGRPVTAPAKASKSAIRSFERWWKFYPKKVAKAVA